jgi:cytochrome c
MDPLFFNKIAGAVLGTLLFVMAITIGADMLLTPAPMAKPGYDLPGTPPASEAQATPAAVTPAEPLPKLLAAADPKRGEADTKVCGVCHNFKEGAGAKIGPDLYGVVGRPKASFPGFAYSDAMKAKGGNWTFEDINTFITKPSAFVPGTKMAFAGESDPHKRADIIAYLDTLSDKPVPLPKP